MRIQSGAYRFQIGFDSSFHHSVALLIAQAQQNVVSMQVRSAV
jgi:hypothetical protein